MTKKASAPIPLLVVFCVVLLISLVLIKYKNCLGNIKSCGNSTPIVNVPSGSPVLSGSFTDCSSDVDVFTLKGEDLTPKVGVKGNGVSVSQLAPSYCESKGALKQELSAKGKELTLTYTYDGKTAAKCSCAYRFEGNISSLDAGRYALKTRFINKYSSPEDVTDQGTASFEIK